MNSVSANSPVDAFEAVAGSSNGFWSENGSMTLLSGDTAMVDNIGVGGMVPNTWKAPVVGVFIIASVALLDGLEFEYAEARSPTGEGGLGKANDSKGVIGSPDMGEPSSVCILSR